MPQDITIGSFVLGGVLVLIALLGGGFKIFGAEVSEKTGTFQRILAGALGVILVVVGLVGSFNSATHQPVDSERPPQASEKGEPAVTPLSSTREDVRPSEGTTIGGRWRDKDGSVYNITQLPNGDITFSVENPANGTQSNGSGTIEGNQIPFTMYTPSGTPGFGNVEISGIIEVIDGRTMVATFFNSIPPGKRTLTKAD